MKETWVYSTADNHYCLVAPGQATKDTLSFLPFSTTDVRNHNSVRITPKTFLRHFECSDIKSEI